MFRTFLDECIAGEAASEQIDEFVERWHNDPSAVMPLQEYLGFTRDEYDNWALHPEAVDGIILAHRISTEISGMVNQR
jgi:hypothetical protein